VQAYRTRAVFGAYLPLDVGDRQMDHSCKRNAQHARRTRLKRYKPRKVLAPVSEQPHGHAPNYASRRGVMSEQRRSVVTKERRSFRRDRRIHNGGEVFSQPASLVRANGWHAHIVSVIETTSVSNTASIAAFAGRPITIRSSKYE
jgi:hypothetical protein